jgi:hypothetical protein
LPEICLAQLVLGEVGRQSKNLAGFISIHDPVYAATV